jgi:hypothetical protein
MNVLSLVLVENIERPGRDARSGGWSGGVEPPDLDHPGSPVFSRASAIAMIRFVISSFAFR